MMTEMGGEMGMLDPGSPLPLYQQLKAVLRRSIESGLWSAGDTIPPERELIERFGVSRITVRQALADLAAEGLLVRKHGKGTFVAPQATAPIAEMLSDLTGHLEELQLRGLEPAIEVLTLERRPISGEAVEALAQAEGAVAWYLYRRVLVAGSPLMLSEVWVPGDLGFAVKLDEVQRMGMAQLLAEHGYAPLRGAQRIAAQTASPDEAKLLGIKRGDALLRVVRVVYGGGDRPLVWFRTLYRADRYEYEVELKRRR